MSKHSQCCLLPIFAKSFSQISINKHIGSNDAHVFLRFKILRTLETGTLLEKLRILGTLRMLTMLTWLLMLL